MITALVLALIQPEPALPIPTGSPLESGPILQFVMSSSFGMKFGARIRDADGVEHHWSSTGIAGSYRTKVEDSDFVRVARLFRIAGNGPRNATRQSWYLANSFSFEYETVDDPRPWPQIKVGIYWYPLEGVGFLTGFDSRTLFDLFSGIQLVF